MGHRTLSSLAILSACCVCAIATSALAQGKKGGDPPPPPVHYTVVWLGTLGGGHDTSGVLAANSHGEIVGLSMDDSVGSSSRLAVRFTPSGPVSLNDEMADLLALRSDGPWRAWIAAGINESGQITGSITQGLGSHPFVYTPGNGALPRELNILPQIAGGITVSRGINNLGQIVGQYEANGGGTFVCTPGGPLIDMGPRYVNGFGELNDAGQIAFSTERYTPTLALGDAGTMEVFPGYLTAINASGDVAGVYTTSATKGKTKTIANVYRARAPGTVEVVYQGPSAYSPLINDQGDVCFSADDRIALFCDGIGLVRIDTTLATPDAKWTNARSTIADALLNPDPAADTGFPIIVGTANLEGDAPDEAFLLIPSAVP